MNYTHDTEMNNRLLKIADQNSDPTVTLNSEMFRDAIVTILDDQLTMRQKAVLDYRFGLTDGFPRTYAEIAGAFSLSTTTITMIERKAFRRLRACRTAKPYTNNRIDRNTLYELLANVA